LIANNEPCACAFIDENDLCSSLFMED